LENSGTIFIGGVSYECDYMKKNHMIVLCLAMLCFVQATSGFSVAGEKTITIENGMWYEESIPGNSYSVAYEVKVLEGSKVDIYIMTETEYLKYKDGENFSTAVSIQNVSTANGEHKFEHKRQYYFVVDNKDNLRVKDATPSSNSTVSINIEVTEHWDSLYVWLFLGLILLACMIVSYFVFFSTVKKEADGITDLNPFFQLEESERRDKKSFRSGLIGLIAVPVFGGIPFGSLAILDGWIARRINSKRGKRGLILGIVDIVATVPIFFIRSLAIVADFIIIIAPIAIIIAILYGLIGEAFFLGRLAHRK